MKQLLQTLAIILITVAATIAILAVFGLVSWNDAAKTGSTVGQVAVIVVVATVLIRWVGTLDKKKDE